MLSKASEPSESGPPAEAMVFMIPQKKPSILPEGEDLAKEVRLRNKCINEIIDTERDYITDLEIVADLFVAPLRGDNIISAADVGKIFSNIEQILQFSRILLEDLEKAAKENKDTLLSQIGNCFKNLVRS